jgi:ABC-type nitrate/sulfonate/bicarbonate transport system substrate-binding protein
LGISQNIANLPLFWALEKQQFQRAGLDMEVEQISGSATVFLANLARSAIDIVQASPSPPVFNQIAEGFESRIPASLGIEKPGRIASGMLVVMKEQASSIRTPADLRGKTIEGLGQGPTGFLANQVASQAGLRVGQDVTITYRARTVQDIFVLVQNKAADVFAMSEPTATQLEKQGSVVKWLTFADVMPWYQPSLLAASSEFTRNRTGLVKFLEVYLTACREINATDGRWTPEVLDIAKKWTKIDDATVLTDQGGVPYYDPNGSINMESLARVQDFWIATNQVPVRVDPARMVDLPALDAAVQAIGRTPA